MDYSLDYRMYIYTLSYRFNIDRCIDSSINHYIHCTRLDLDKIKIGLDHVMIDVDRSTARPSNCRETATAVKTDF